MLHEQLTLATLPNTGTRLYIPWGNFVLLIYRLIVRGRKLKSNY